MSEHSEHIVSSGDRFSPELEQIFATVPEPSSESLRNVDIARNITAGLAATLEAADLEIRNARKKTVAHARFVFGQHEIDQQIPTTPGALAVRLYDTGETRLIQDMHTTHAAEVALAYAYYTESGVKGEGGIPHEVLATADKLLTQGETNPKLNEALKLIALSAWADILVNETQETAKSLSIRGGAAHNAANKAHDLLQSLQEGEAIPAEVLKVLGKAFGFAEHAVASVIPGGNFAEGEVKKVVKALRESPEQTEGYLFKILAGKVKDGPEITMNDVKYLLDGISISDQFEIPVSMDRNLLAKALATRLLLRNAKDIAEGNLGNVSDPFYRRTRLLAEIAAVFDGCQNEQLSLLHQAGMSVSGDLPTVSVPTTTPPTQ